ncbi:MAG: hypothetical protein M0C28_47990 [Candidatus Moduliflexus flocculans]|nr:hypothetical protein [Candidatus Moduliflexus flocculans]
MTMTVSLAGFKTWIQDNLILGAGSTLEVNLPFSRAPSRSRSPSWPPARSSTSRRRPVDSRLDKELLAKLPTSRDAVLRPGPDDAGHVRRRQQRRLAAPSPTAYGGSSMENVFLVNGVNTTNPRGAAFGSLVKVNYNAVEEVRVVALGSKAEYGELLRRGHRRPDPVRQQRSSTATRPSTPSSGAASSRRTTRSPRSGTPTCPWPPPTTGCSTWPATGWPARPRRTGRATSRSAGRSSRTRSGSTAPSTTSGRRRLPVNWSLLNNYSGRATPTSRYRPNRSGTPGPGCPTTTRTTRATAGAGAPSRTGTPR